MQRLSGRARRMSGFTLIELMLAIALVGVLAAIALPSFVDSVRAGRRADALTALAQLQQAQERWRAEHASYAASLTELGLKPASPNGWYTLAVEAANESGYILAATVANAQLGDDACHTMRLRQDGGELSTTASDVSGQELPAPASRCWRGA